MPFEYAKNKTNVISFPLGGIGAGCIGLAGNGRLIDWEIFNRPNKGSLNGMSHFAVRAERNGEVLDTRILHGDLHPPYIGELGATGNQGFGWGPHRENLCGMPHFRDHVFKGKYPFAEIVFSGEETFPGDVSLHAWSPFIPGNEDDSGLPGAFFEVEITNTSDAEIDYTVIGALSNPFGQENAVNRVTQRNSIHTLTVSNSAIAPNDPAFGELTISTDAESISYQEYWYRGQWCDSLEIYWRDLLAGGRFQNRTYDSGIQETWEKCDTGHLASHIKLAAGESRRVRFLITWHVPNCTNYWKDREDYRQRIAENGLENTWKNWYATQWKNANDSATYGMANWNRLHEETHTFHNALFASTLPEIALEAISANLSTLKTPTCLRLEDGTFYGWEGAGCTGGCCEGSCTHVWNYAQAMAFLFPRLERSMRTVNYRYAVDDLGGSHFRLQLPLGVKATRNDIIPCPDGQFGDVIKAYRDWKISGDTNWLRDLWPTIRKTIEYAWSDENPDRWDPDKTGVLQGRQHHTLDMELFGPNAWLTGYYLAALKAASKMAPTCGDDAFGEECYALFQKGKQWADANLFNGEYYHQVVDLTNRDLLISFDQTHGDTSDCGCGRITQRYWSEEHGQIKYQVGEGCEIDMTIGQWHANIYGLGEIYNPQQIRTALASTYKYSYKTSMRDAYNPWRIYTLNDEGGLLICSWPEDKEKPMIPLPYAQEDQGGYTYAAAIHMIQAGLIDEGLQVITTLRGRYDGEKRNPWNEIECGNNYARTMASYALLNTFSKFQFDQVNGFIGFSPLLKNTSDFRCLWSLDGAWGEVIYTSKHVELRILSGKLNLNAINFGISLSTVEIDGTQISSISEEKQIKFAETQTITNTLIAKKAH